MGTESDIVIDVLLNIIGKEKKCYGLNIKSDYLPYYGEIKRDKITWYNGYDIP